MSAVSWRRMHARYHRACVRVADAEGVVADAEALAERVPEDPDLTAAVAAAWRRTDRARAAHILAADCLILAIADAREDV